MELLLGVSAGQPIRSCTLSGIQSDLLKTRLASGAPARPEAYVQVCGQMTKRNGQPQQRIYGSSVHKDLAIVPFSIVADVSHRGDGWTFQLYFWMPGCALPMRSAVFPLQCSQTAS